jgi:hypothetical protein
MVVDFVTLELSQNNFAPFPKGNFPDFTSDRDLDDQT